MSKSTVHSALVVVTSNGSGGRAEIIFGHSGLVKGFTDPFLTSSRFKNFPVGTPLIVGVRLTAKRRSVFRSGFDNNLFDDSEEASKRLDECKVGGKHFPSFRRFKVIDSFKTRYAPTLEEESKVYNLTYGIDESFRADKGIVVEPTTVEIEERDTSFSDKIYINIDDNKLFDAIKKISESRHVSVMLRGGSGYGKTSIAEQKAKDWDMNFLRWDCANITDPEEFFGVRGAMDGSTMNEDGTLFLESSFTKHVKEGNCVIVLDEANRLDPRLSNVLFPLLDHKGSTEIAGHTIKVGPNVIFMATVNVGFQYAGTFQIDEAFANRFMVDVKVGPLPIKIEEKVLLSRTEATREQVNEVITLLTKLRALAKNGKLTLDASTRVSINMCELLATGLSLRSVVKYSILNSLGIEEAKRIVDIVNTL